MPGVSCSSRHSRRSRAATPGGSSFCTTARARSARARSSFVGVRPQQVFQAALQIAVGVEVVDDPLAHRPQGRLDLEPAQLIVEIVLQRLRPGDHVGHGVELPLAGLFRPRRARDGSAPRSGRATPRPSSSAARNRPRCWCVSSMTSSRSSSVGASGDLRTSGSRPSSAGRSGSSSCSSSTGFSSISCSIRSCRARMGNCRISIDWIIRGASTCFCTNPQGLDRGKVA